MPESVLQVTTLFVITVTIKITKTYKVNYKKVSKNSVSITMSAQHSGINYGKPPNFLNSVQYVSIICWGVLLIVFFFFALYTYTALYCTVLYKQIQYSISLSFSWGKRGGGIHTGDKGEVERMANLWHLYSVSGRKSQQILPHPPPPPDPCERVTQSLFAHIQTPAQDMFQKSLLLY